MGKKRISSGKKDAQPIQKDDKEASGSRKRSLDKSERKLEKKVKFYTKVKTSISSLNAQKLIAKNKKSRSRQKKLKAYDMSALSEFLPELKSKQQKAPAQFKLNCKSRQKLMLEERKRLVTVLNHPAFQLDPLEAIHQHLQSTQPVVEEKPKKKANKNGSQKAKQKKSKASNEPRTMEF